VKILPGRDPAGGRKWLVFFASGRADSRAGVQATGGLFWLSGVRLVRILSCTAFGEGMSGLKKIRPVPLFFSCKVFA